MSSPHRNVRATTPTPPDHRTATVHHLLTAVVEAVDGRRPLRQLAAHLTPPAAAEVGKALGQGARLNRMRVCRISPEVTELSAVVSTRTGRVRALAARMEWSGDRWRCTAFHLLP
ncbi:MULTISPECIES: Rv3235 family protein [unclassified Saccharothrix]|uniref:Rv3235 family protein n=1 Tax=unclassified Saccharothrix TaxID=2593673 RepID=UPI00307F77A9